MKLSVLVPTCNRPSMLRTALSSVLAQSALGHVSEVLVIENGLDKLSQSVCDEFPMLPIRYVFNQVPIPPGRLLMQEWVAHVKEECFALLFDDDWWADIHLERGIRSFSTAEDVTAAYGACVWTRGEDGCLEQLFGQFNMWFAADVPVFADRWSFRIHNMLVANLISTTCHFSSLIVRRSAWEECINMLDDNPFDIDRSMAVLLSAKGAVVLDRIPSVFIRRHCGQEGVRMNNDVGRYWFDQTTKWLMAIAEDHNVNLAFLFRRLMHEKGVSADDLKCHGSFGSVDLLVDMGIVPVVSSIAKQGPTRLQRTTVALRGLIQMLRSGIRAVFGRLM